MVSIVIPIHNVEPYIERCLYSVIRQTYSDIECVLIDDACTDRSMLLCEKIIREYDGPIQFKTIHLQTSQGPSGGRNIGTETASGEYIFYLDSDDEITDDCIEKLFYMTLLYPDVEIVHGGIWSERNAEYYNMSKYANVRNVTDNIWLRKEFLKLQGGLPTVVWNKLIKKEFIKNHNISFEPDIIHEDELWMFNVIKYLRNACFVSDITYRHYSVSGSIMTDLKVDYSNKCWSIILDRIIDGIKEPMMEEQIKKYLWLYLQKESYYKSMGYRTPLLRKMLHKARGKLKIALIAYILLGGASLKMYLHQYCATGAKAGLWEQMYYDFKSSLRNKIRK